MMMTLKANTSMSMSKDHTLNMNSSKESELVGIYKLLSIILWAKYLIEAQGHVLDHTILLQDK